MASLNVHWANENAVSKTKKTRKKDGTVITEKQMRINTISFLELGNVGYGQIRRQ